MRTTESAGVAGRGRVLTALVATMALTAMDTTIVATTVPQVVADLGGFSLFSWVFSSYLLAQTVTIPIYGKLADSYGRKPVLLAGSGIFLLGSLLCAISPNMVSLIIFRAIQGIGAGGAQATISTVASDLYSIAERGRVQAWLSSVWGISAVVAPMLGGAFAEYVSWRWIFLVNLPIGAVALFLLVRYLHEDVPNTRRKVDYLGASLVLLAAGLLLLGLLQGGTGWAWSSPMSIGVFVAAGVFGLLAVFVERRAAEPILPPWLFQRRVIAGSCLAMLGMGVLVIGPTSFLPTYGQSLLGLGPIEAGLVLASMSITWPLASAVSARLYLRIGFRNTALVGALLCALGGGTLFTLPDPGSVVQCVLAAAVLGAGFGLITAALMVGVQAGLGWSQRGVATGAVQFSRFLGSALGAAVYGAVSNTTMANRLAEAPDRLAGQLPGDVNGVSEALGEGELAGQSAEYLRHTLYSGMHNVFLVLLIVGVLIVAILLFLTPRRFPVLDEQVVDRSAGSAADAPARSD
ncbi:EmrB/QacA subfamily drug resistance transporter [Tamaricihabitans halophyticus]|uniref:EmrB/QacA subfamily drug resistance transporter n=1 Tax=Tamaricihabitans halophyticus TaxID=1262583 RepID=A0A4R2Q239_9PSEU|nr:MDR family MFS transporter [Tamaricihabitans halophyticus]TCP40671.1 EmrB/QacA subfamily drug resistance transporter [Tamaricihabitans halophyticus]